MLLIDAYNVLHVSGILPPELAGPDVADLVRLIARSRYADRELTVVCDGVGSKSHGVSLGAARVLFSGTEREADDLIEVLITRFGRGRTLEVVSSDRRLHRAARRGKAGVISAEVFLGHLAEDHRRVTQRDRTGGWAPRAQVPLDRYSVEAWMAEFGLEVEAGPAVGAGPEGAEERGGGAEEIPEGPAVEPGRKRWGRAKLKRRDATAGGLGERLVVPGVPERVPEREPAPEPLAEPEPEPAGVDSGPVEVGELDPVLRAALEEWREVLSADDLDMSRWIDGVEPL